MERTRKGGFQEGRVEEYSSEGKGTTGVGR